MTRRHLEAIGLAVLVATGGVLVAVGYALAEIGRAVSLPASRVRYVVVPDFVPQALTEDPL